MLQDYVRVAVYQLPAKSKSVVFLRDVILGVGLLELTNVELGVLLKLTTTTIVRMAPRFP